MQIFVNKGTESSEEESKTNFFQNVRRNVGWNVRQIFLGM